MNESVRYKIGIMITFLSGQYMCYNTTCKYTSKEPEKIQDHTVAQHLSEDNFSLRSLIFDESTGHIAYRSLHFDIKITKLLKKIKDGIKPRINIENKTISFKRTVKYSSNTEDTDQSKESQTLNAEVYNLIPDVIDELTRIGKLPDFFSMLKAISNGVISNNIAFHLLLDVANFYSQPTIYSTRYSPESLSFWITVKKLFKGKGINFFRGYKGEGLDSTVPVQPRDCQINFAVPCDSIISKESGKYVASAHNPGSLTISLDAFAEVHSGNDVKLSID